MQRKTFVLFVLLFGLVCCEDRDGGRLLGFYETEEALNAFLAFKNIHPSNKKIADVAYAKFKQDTRTATYLENKSVIPEDELHIAVQDFKNNYILNRYLGKVVSKQLNDDSLLSYYQSLSDEYTLDHAFIGFVSVSKHLGQKDRSLPRRLISEIRTGILEGKIENEITETYRRQGVNLSSWYQPVWKKVEGNVDELKHNLKLNEVGMVGEIVESNHEFAFYMLHAPFEKRIIPFDVVKAEVTARYIEEIKEKELERIIDLSE